MVELKNPGTLGAVDGGTQFIKFLWDECSAELELLNQKEINVIWDVIWSNTTRPKHFACYDQECKSGNLKKVHQGDKDIEKIEEKIQREKDDFIELVADRVAARFDKAMQENLQAFRNKLDWNKYNNIPKPKVGDNLKTEKKKDKI